MKAYKNRTVDTNKKVEVYFNLHKKCFSVRQNGLIVAHTDAIVLTDVVFNVSESRRQEVLRTKRKNVHATVRGYISNVSSGILYCVTYNPYKNSTFVFRGSKKPIHECDYIDMVIANKKIPSIMVKKKP